MDRHLKSRGNGVHNGIVMKGEQDRFLYNVIIGPVQVKGLVWLELKHERVLFLTATPSYARYGVFILSVTDIHQGVF